MNIQQNIFEEAKSLIRKRYPNGLGGAAAMYSKNSNTYTSVVPEIINNSTSLCIETGSILDAHKHQDIITHAICVVRDDENSDFKILTPYGTCQERLLYWDKSN
ncbi:cytidine deaminase [Mammaliicoccus stepanovicii]|uniref:Cytidine deaminase n=1 Tax=Mammaliicoccus stepanovicii TaxID=643214 RepID=A0A239ZM22_9STAP|nr:hypothetical protein GCM10010896_14150 [Mammaliicoccus stepanovicii]SNV71794.1 cytidine deaminase [Mammaliicoccus stepanovicii]